MTSLYFTLTWHNKSQGNLLSTLFFNAVKMLLAYHLRLRMPWYQLSNKNSWTVLDLLHSICSLYVAQQVHPILRYASFLIVDFPWKVGSWGTYSNLYPQCFFGPKRYFDPQVFGLKLILSKLKFRPKLEFEPTMFLLLK